MRNALVIGSAACLAVRARYIFFPVLRKLGPCKIFLGALRALEDLLLGNKGEISSQISLVSLVFRYDRVVETPSTQSTRNMTTVSDLKHQPASISGDDKIGNNLSCMVRQPKLNGKGKVRKVQYRKRRRKRKTAQTEMGTEENVEENEHLNDDDDEKIETNVQARKVDDVGDASDSTLRAGLRTGQKH